MITDIPTSTKSLTLIVTDPDAPARPWVHWLVFNIPPTLTDITENQIPPGGTEGYANGGTHGYEGPCPPRGEHRYVFTLYALDVTLNLPDTADRSAVLEAMRGHILAQTELTGVYQRENPF